MELFGFNIPVWLILILLVVYLVYRHLVKTFDTFKKMNIPGPKPYPLVGTMMDMYKQGMQKHDQWMKDTYGNVVGSFLGSRPCLMLYDPDVMKKIMVKDFAKFSDRYIVTFAEYPFDSMLINLTGSHWKHVRNHVSPTFSGSKLRKMVDQINRCAKNLTDSVEIAAKAGDMIEIKEYAGAFTTDVIAATAFSIDINSQVDKKGKFLVMSRLASDFDGFSFTMIIYMFFPFLIPYLSKFGVSIFPKVASNFFMDIIDRSIKDREENPDQIPTDFLQLMLSAQLDESDEEALAKESSSNPGKDVWSKSGLTKEEVLAQALLFFMAGHETTAASIAMTIYNLAINPECQEKAHTEIIDVIGKDGVPTYDDMKKMKYLEMCMEETLRLYPPAPRSDRVATEDYELDNGLVIPKGMLVGLPVYVLQHDPEVWPDPFTFDPERFTPEAKQERHMFNYMPFGIGPRSCVAQRFAILEVKMALAHLLQKFKFVRCEKTQVPLVLKKMKVEGEKGTFVKAELRE